MSWNERLTARARTALGLFGDKYPADMERHSVLPDGRAVRLVKASRSQSTSGWRTKHSFFHRIEVQCRSCRKWIPVGRMHQHQGTATCYRNNHAMTGRDAGRRTSRDPGARTVYESHGGRVLLQRDRKGVYWVFIDGVRQNGFQSEDDRTAYKVASGDIRRAERWLAGKRLSGHYRSGGRQWKNKKRYERDMGSELRKYSLQALGRMLRQALKQGDEHKARIIEQEIDRRSRRR
jgi:hypothetical protein